jgi:hypothetical protein
VRHEQAAGHQTTLDQELGKRLDVQPEAPRAQELAVRHDRPARRACLSDVHVTSGGIVLTYAGTGPETAIDDEVRRMANVHNRRHAEHTPLESVGVVHSIALVENVSRGSRIVLIADDAIDMADLYSHLESDARALIPTGSLQQGWCESSPGSPAATIK